MLAAPKPKVISDRQEHEAVSHMGGRLTNGKSEATAFILELGFASLCDSETRMADNTVKACVIGIGCDVGEFVANL